jgi:hypothetical protein
MEDNNENSWCDEMADFIMDNLFPEYADDLWPEHKTIGENGELPVLWDDDGDPIFPQRYDAFPLPEDELANKLIRSLIGTAQKHSGWLWN